jgi:hypothetical protein
MSNWDLMLVKFGTGKGLYGGLSDECSFLSHRFSAPPNFLEAHIQY